MTHVSCQKCVKITSHLGEISLYVGRLRSIGSLGLLGDTVWNELNAEHNNSL